MYINIYNSIQFLLVTAFIDFLMLGIMYLAHICVTIHVTTNTVTNKYKHLGYSGTVDASVYDQAMLTKVSILNVVCICFTYLCLKD